MSNCANQFLTILCQSSSHISLLSAVIRHLKACTGELGCTTPCLRHVGLGAILPASWSAFCTIAHLSSRESGMQAVCNSAHCSPPGINSFLIVTTFRRTVSCAADQFLCIARRLMHWQSQTRVSWSWSLRWECTAGPTVLPSDTLRPTSRKRQQFNVLGSARPSFSSAQGLETLIGVGIIKYASSRPGDQNDDILKLDLR